MKYALPTEDGTVVGKVFGRAGSFAIYDDADGSMTIMQNGGGGAEHGAGTGASALLVDKGIGAVIAPEVGPKAAGVLQAAGVAIGHAEPGTELKKAVELFIAQSR